MEYVIYRKYTAKEHAEPLLNILEEHGVAFEVAEVKANLDLLYGQNPMASQYFIKLKKDDFAKVDAILLDANRQQLETVNKDHYLYSFSDEELFDVLAKPDEWNEFDHLLAKKILKDRGKEINDHTIELLKKQRVSELAKPDEYPKGWIYAGYIFVLFGGIIGMFIGWHLNTFKKTLPNGDRVYAHSESERRHGKIILILGAIMIVLWGAARLTNEYR